MHSHKHVFYLLGNINLQKGKMFVSRMCMGWKKKLLFHLFLLCCVFYSPLSFACAVNAAALKLLLLRAAGLKQGGCQSPFLTQQHVHCLNIGTVTHPVFPSPGDRRPPSQRGGMTLLSGMLKIPNLSTLVCEFKSPLLEAGLGLQLMTLRYRGSEHWWAGVLRHCASWAVHFFSITAHSSPVFSSLLLSPNHFL